MKRSPGAIYGGPALAVSAAMALALLAACAAPAAATPTPSAVPTPNPTPQPGGAAGGAAAQDAAARAVADLAARLMVAPADIQILAIEPQTWPDTSLGLPEPGQSYAQVVTNGYIVTLQYVRQTFVYHVAGDIVRIDTAHSAPLPPGLRPSGPIATP